MNSDERMSAVAIDASLRGSLYGYSSADVR